MKKPIRSDYLAIAKRIQAWRRPLLLSHAKPDGDALGSLLAAALFLQDVRSNPLITLFDPVPERYRFLELIRPLPTLGVQIRESDLQEVDGVLILDTCTYNQMEPLAAWLKQSRAPKVAIDHHVTRDALADEFLIDESAAATCLMLYDLAVAADWKLSPDIATALFVGLATDTGWFRHSNTDARVLAAASIFSSEGAIAHELHRKLYQCETAARFRLRSFALANTEWLCDGRLAVTTIPWRAFAQCGAGLADTEDLINEPLQVESVVASVLFVEHDNGVIRVGLRSKAPLSASDPDVDVAALARSFGGGGHVRASGVRFQTTMEEAKRTLLQPLRERLAPRP